MTDLNEDLTDWRYETPAYTFNKKEIYELYESIKDRKNQRCKICGEMMDEWLIHSCKIGFHEGQQKWDMRASQLATVHDQWWENPIDTQVTYIDAHDSDISSAEESAYEVARRMITVQSIMPEYQENPWENYTPESEEVNEFQNNEIQYEVYDIPIHHRLKTYNWVYRGERYGCPYCEETDHHSDVIYAPTNTLVARFTDAETFTLRNPFWQPSSEEDVIELPPVNIQSNNQAESSRKRTRPNARTRRRRRNNLSNSY